MKATPYESTMNPQNNTLWKYKDLIQWQWYNEGYTIWEYHEPAEQHSENIKIWYNDCDTIKATRYESTMNPQNNTL